MSKFKSSYPEHQKYEDAITVHASSALIATGNDAGSVEIPDCTALVVQAYVSPALAVGDTLDLFLQTCLPILGVDVWTDVVAFTQILGNGGIQRWIEKINSNLAQAAYETVAGAALAAGQHRHIFGTKWHCRWVIAGVTPSFLTEVRIYPIK